jgi:hypothetical protein
MLILFISKNVMVTVFNVLWKLVLLLSAPPRPPYIYCPKI